MMMDILYIMNHVVFSLFITLFLVEVGMAFTGLIFYDSYKIIKKYLIPMWEINGTFAIFYIVSFEAIYPKLLVNIGTLYLLPVMVAALLLILRNADAPTISLDIAPNIPPFILGVILIL